MPLNTGAALAVSLIPAAVILVYNLMENGVPGGASFKNFISTDKLFLDSSASSITLKNISLVLNTTTDENNSIENLSGQIRNLSATTLAALLVSTEISTETIPATTDDAAAATATTEIPAVIAFANLPTTTTTESTTTTATTTTTSSTTEAAVPLIVGKLPVCCDKVRASGNKLSGSCESEVEDVLSAGTEGRVWSVPQQLMASQVETKFELSPSSISSKEGKFIGQLPLVSDAFSADHHFLNDGMLKYKNEYYRPDEYCIRGVHGDQISVEIVNVNCSNPATPCVHKCCGYEEIYSMGMKGQRGGCLRMDPSRNESTWSPTLYDEFGGRLTAQELAVEGIRPHVIQSNPTTFRHFCPRNATTVFPYGQQVADFLAAVLRYPFTSLKFMMRKDGFLMNPNANLRNVAISRSKRTTNYCIDGVMNYGEDEPFMNLESQTVLFLCLGAPEELELNSKDLKSENLIASSSDTRSLFSTALPPTSSSSSTTTTEKVTTTTTAATPEPTTISTSTTSTTTTTTPPPSPTTVVTKTTTTSSTTTPPPNTTLLPSSTTTPISSTTTPPPPTTTSPLPTSTLPPTTTNNNPPTTIQTDPTTTEAPPVPTPVLPVCCSLDPDANDDGEGVNEVSHHCKSTPDSNNVISVDSAFNSSWIASPNFMFTHKITKFRLEVKPLKCQKWTKAFVHNLGKLLSPTEPVLMPDGSLKMGTDYFRQGEFCVNGVFPNIVEVLACKTNCSDPQTPCIQKCCAPNEVYSLGVGGKKRGCVPLSAEDTPFDPPLYKNMAAKLSDEELENMTPHLVQKYPPKFQYSCYKNVTLVFPFSSDVVQLMSPLAQINLEFRLRRDGKVIYKHPSIRDASGELIESAFSTYNFCVDGIRNFGEPQGPYTNPENQTILFVCAVNPPAKA